MLTSAKDLLTEALRAKKAIPAFNVSSIDLLQVIFEEAAELKVPVIIETSAGEMNYFLPEVLVGICEKLSQLYKVDYILHLDRGTDLAIMERCLKAGYNSIACEFGNLPLAENLVKTKAVHDLTDLYGAQLEGAVEVVPLTYYQDAAKTKLTITEPENAIEYVETTGVDSLVVSVGTQSGKYKEVNEFRLDVVSEINKNLPNLPLVLHGGSYLELEQYHAAIAAGIAKININAECREAYTQQLKLNINNNPAEYAPYRLLGGVKDALRPIVRQKLTIFNKINKLPRTKVHGSLFYKK